MEKHGELGVEICLQQPVLFPALPSRNGDPLLGRIVDGNGDPKMEPKSRSVFPTLFPILCLCSESNLKSQGGQKRFQLPGLTRGFLSALCATWAEIGKMGALGEGEATEEGRNHLKPTGKRFLLQVYHRDVLGTRCSVMQSFVSWGKKREWVNSKTCKCLWFVKRKGGKAPRGFS